MIIVLGYCCQYRSIDSTDDIKNNASIEHQFYQIIYYDKYSNKIDSVQTLTNY